MEKTTKVYRYGLLAPRAEDEAVINEQIRAAHDYYNVRIRIERDRRAERNVLTAPLGDLPKAQALVEEAKAERDRIADEIKAWRSKHRKQQAPKPKRQALKDAKAAYKAAREKYNALRQKIQQDPAVQEGFAEIDARADKARKDARAACGCYWGTYLTVEAATAAASGTANPRFKRWRRSNPATLAVQLQGGRSAEAVFEDNTLFRIEETPQPRGKAQHTITMRVGTKENQAVWASWPLIYHRPLPEDAQIKWVKVKRETRAAKDYWSLHLTVETGAAPRKARGALVAVDVGWRKAEDGMRVGYWQDENGGAAPIMLDPLPDPNRIRDTGTIMERFRKVEDLCAIRDDRMNMLVTDLKAWMRGRKGLPDWLREARRVMHLWRSQDRFAGLYYKWRRNRFPKDDGGYEMLTAWRKKDKHLWTWEANLRTTTQRRRAAHYQRVAMQLAEQYGTLVINDFDLRKTQRHATLESGKHEIDQVRWQQTKACCSSLRETLKQAFWRRGGYVILVPAAMVTRKCTICGYDEPWTRPEELVHTCENPDLAIPQHSFDRDLNSTTNMLRAASEGKEIWPVKRKARWAKRHKKAKK